MRFDLAYLDANCRVIDLVESFPHLHVLLSGQPAASVLVLPSKAISCSDTHRGDLIAICAADQPAMLLRTPDGARSRIHAVPSSAQSPDQSIARTQPFPSGEQPQCDRPPEEAALSNARGPIEKTRGEERATIISPRQGFLARLLSLNPNPADRRNARRHLIDNLLASFWTGGAPTLSAVRDISASGLYVVTSERWYPGTVIRMTLSITRAVGEALGASICVPAEAIRWGNDGVGLRFVVDNRRKKGNGQYQPVEGADRRQLEQFLHMLLHEKQQTGSRLSV